MRRYWKIALFLSAVATVLYIASRNATAAPRELVALETPPAASVAYATLVEGDNESLQNYARSAAVLLCSLVRYGAVAEGRPLLVLAAYERVERVQEMMRQRTPPAMRGLVKVVGVACEVPPEAAKHIAATHHERFRHTWCKLGLWTLEAWDRIVYLDADAVAIDASVRDLERWPRLPAMAPDFLAADRPNGGVIVLHPQLGVHAELRAAAAKAPTVDGSEQDVLGYVLAPHWYGTAAMLPLALNWPAWLDVAHPHLRLGLRSQVGVLHYAGEHKPWIESTGRRIPNQWRDAFRPWRALAQECVI